MQQAKIVAAEQGWNASELEDAQIGSADSETAAHQISKASGRSEAQEQLQVEKDLETSSSEVSSLVRTGPTGSPLQARGNFRYDMVRPLSCLVFVISFGGEALRCGIQGCVHALYFARPGGPQCEPSSCRARISLAKASTLLQHTPYVRAQELELGVPLRMDLRRRKEAEPYLSPLSPFLLRHGMHQLRPTTNVAPSLSRQHS